MASLNVTSTHQQPASVAPHVNLWPHASQEEAAEVSHERREVSCTISRRFAPSGFELKIGFSNSKPIS